MFENFSKVGSPDGVTSSATLTIPLMHSKIVDDGETPSNVHPRLFLFGIHEVRPPCPFVWGLLARP
jgi:hypothetical protein